MTVDNLRCEYQVNPLGIDTQHPRFSWWLESKERGAKQTAYSIIVSSSLKLLKEGRGDMWSTGIVPTDQSIQVTNNGKNLESNTEYFWKVCVWNQHGAERTEWSKTATFRTGLFEKSDWKAAWIQRHPKETFAPVDPFGDDPSPLLRKEFTLDKPIKKATLFGTGLGYFELRLNGTKVGDHQLDPGWTDFSKRVSYQAFDVTKQLQKGANAIGAILGNGWYNIAPLPIFGINLRKHLPVGDPKVLVQLEVEFTDGTKQTVVTDPSWKAGDSPILRNSVYLGEVYDARMEQPGWDKPGFDDNHWGSAILADSSKLGELQTQRTPPIRITKTVKPLKITEPKPGVFIVDYGQNFAGWTRMRVKGSAGTRVRLRSGELIYEDGTLNAMTTVAGQIKGGGKDYVYDGKGQPKTAFQIDEYICKGQGVEVFQPRFTFHGFRYVEVTGYPGKPTLADFEGERLNSDVEKVGSFECSNPMFNQLQTMIEWTFLSNIFSVQSDCPHREKLGYGGDQVVTSEMAMFTYDMARFYSNTVEVLKESQRDNGGFTETAPYVGIADEGLGGQSGPIGWGTAFPQLFMDLNKYYGTSSKPTRLEKDSWTRWVALILSNMKEESPYLLKNGIGDHETLATKSTILTGSAFMYQNIALANFTFLGNGVSDRNENLKQTIYEQINSKLLNRETGKYDIGTQCCQAMPLALGLVPDDMKAKVLDVLIKDIEAHDGHLTTGIFGTKYLFQALSDAGRDDIAYRIANQRTFPGYGYMIEHGATTLWEHWEFSDNVYSHNHPMFGSVSEWFYKSILGIRRAAPGFKKIVIKPSIVGDLTYAKGHHDCPYGRIESSWKREGKSLTLDVTIPPNTTATVYVPSISDEVLEGGKPALNAPGIKFVRHENGATVFEVESGSYRFGSSL